MTTTALIIDDFLPDFEVARQWVESTEFADVRNDIDGVVYPGIATNVPGWLLTEVCQSLRKAGVNPICRSIFARLSLKGVQAPHSAHTDNSMGQMSMMLYLNREDDCEGGTSLLRHGSGMERAPSDPWLLTMARDDSNEYGRWTPTVFCGMKSNRAFVFEADCFHRAEPVGGFGTDVKDGRLVLTMFFDKGRV